MWTLCRLLSFFFRKRFGSILTTDKQTDKQTTSLRKGTLGVNTVRWQTGAWQYSDQQDNKWDRDVRSKVFVDQRRSLPQTQTVAVNTLHRQWTHHVSCLEPSKSFSKLTTHLLKMFGVHVLALNTNKHGRKGRTTAERRKKTAQRFVSLNIVLIHSRSLKVIQNDTAE